MELVLDFLRTTREQRNQYRQRVTFETEWLAEEAENASVATALTYLNMHPEEIRDAEGNVFAEIAWECGCLQKRCGVCAMVIDGVPRLACEARLSEFYGKGRVTIEPLKKFPVVEDLVVDRRALYTHLREMRKDAVLQPVETPLTGARRQLVYESARCLQCGCCLEVCPNFATGGRFFGTAAAIPAGRNLVLAEGDRKAARKSYRRHVFDGCGKSLACRNICPAGIDVDHLLLHNTAIAVWGRRVK